MEKKSLSINAILNVVKQCIRIVFPLITYPYLSRTLGIKNIGTYNFYDSLVQILLIVSTLGIPTYAIREGAIIRHDKNKLTKFSSEIFTINFIATLLAYVVLIVLIIVVPRINRDYIIALVLSLDFFTTLMGRDWLNCIHEDYLIISLEYVFSHLIALILILSFVKSANHLLVYVIIMTLANTGGNLFNIIYTRKYVSLSVSPIEDTYRHLKPIVFMFCTSIATTIYVRSDVVMLGFMVSEQDVGMYTISTKIYMVVKSILNAVIMVSIPRLAKLHGEKNNTRYLNLLSKLRNALELMIFPSVVGLFSLSASMMEFMSGLNEQNGIVSLRILSASLLFAVFACYLANCVLIVDNKENIVFYATLVSAIVNISLNFMLIPLMNIMGAAVTTLISEITVFSICLFYSYKLIKEKGRLLDFRNRSFAIIIIGCLIIYFICMEFGNIIKSNLVHIFISLILSIIIYALLLLLTKNSTIYAIISDIRRKINQ